MLTQPLPSGVRVSPEDIRLEAALLPHSELYYREDNESPIGSITTRSMKAGEILDRRFLSQHSNSQSAENISIAIAASDIPLNASVGDLVALYQVHDSRNGEAVPPPRRVIAQAFIAALDSRKGNFGGELSLTLSIDQEEVVSLLAATSSGRLVLVGSNG